MATRHVTLSCHCGEVRGRVDTTRGTGQRVVCYCRDCQAYARHLGAAGTLDGHGGTEIWQTTPDRIEIESGADALAALRMSRRGLLRWYARCCNTPVANTLKTPGFPFAGLPVVIFPDPDARDRLGPVMARVFTAHAAPPNRKLTDQGGGWAGAGILLRGLTARVRGRRTTPFFDATGAPRVTPHVLTAEERAAAYAPRS